MTWTALIPIKDVDARKTRLAQRLMDVQRVKLSEYLLQHDLSVLNQCPAISEIRILSKTRPSGWNGRLDRDEGKGLNPELMRLCAELGKRPVLVLLPDLPLLTVEDVSILLQQAASGCAIAPDRHGQGTNAIALLNAQAFPFAFGTKSFERHLESAGRTASIVSRLGLSLDLDMPVDLDEVMDLTQTNAAAAHFASVMPLAQKPESIELH